MKKTKMSLQDLAWHLEEMSRAVSVNGSHEGSIHYRVVYGSDPVEFWVEGSHRVEGSDGDGGIILVGVVEASDEALYG